MVYACSDNVNLVHASCVVRGSITLNGRLFTMAQYDKYFSTTTSRCCLVYVLRYRCCALHYYA
jgi:hypothetical protein